MFSNHHFWGEKSPKIRVFYERKFGVKKGTKIEKRGHERAVTRTPQSKSFLVGFGGFICVSPDAASCAWF